MFVDNILLTFASILSGITEIFEIEFKDVTPFIVRVLVPIPEIFAPILFNISHNC